MKKYIAFDVGGSFVKYGVINQDGEILYKNKMPTDSFRGADELMDKLCDSANMLKQRYECDFVSIATTGIVDSYKGTIQSEISSWIEGYCGMNIKEKFEKSTSLITEVENDVNCMALAENWLGSAQGIDNAVFMTIGTGIGGALLINGELYRGNANMAMEIGRMPMFPSVLEELASVRALVYEYAKMKNIPSGQVDGVMVIQKVMQGEVTAIKALDMMCFYLAKGIAAIVSALTPSVIVIGGAICVQKDLLDERIKRNLKQYMDEVFFDAIDIRYAKLENMAGLIGSVRHHQIMSKRRKEEKVNGKEI